MPRFTLGPFSIDIPVGWTLSSVILAGPPEKAPTLDRRATSSPTAFQRNLVATCEEVSDTETAESYLQRQVDVLQKAGVTRWEEVDPRKVTLSKQLTGIISEQVIVGVNGEEVRQMQLVTIRENLAYTVIASHSNGAAFDNSRAEFEKMLLSFS